LASDRKRRLAETSFLDEEGPNDIAFKDLSNAPKMSDENYDKGIPVFVGVAYFLIEKSQQDVFWYQLVYFAPRGRSQQTFVFHSHAHC
jgi:hypothetical protein